MQATPEKQTKTFCPSSWPSTNNTMMDDFVVMEKRGMLITTRKKHPSLEALRQWRFLFEHKQKNTLVGLSFGKQKHPVSSCHPNGVLPVPHRIFHAGVLLRATNRSLPFNLCLVLAKSLAFWTL